MGKPRVEVRAMSRAMETKLAENDHKPHWQNSERGWLLRRISQELGELRRAIQADSRLKKWPRTWTDAERRASERRIVREAADVANFAMMVADVSVSGGIKRYRAARKAVR